jgi:hypothetical protein
MSEICFKCKTYALKHEHFVEEHITVSSTFMTCSSSLAPYGKFENNVYKNKPHRTVLKKLPIVNGMSLTA